MTFTSIDFPPSASQRATQNADSKTFKLVWFLGAFDGVFLDFPFFLVSSNIKDLLSEKIINKNFFRVPLREYGPFYSS